MRFFCGVRCGLEDLNDCTSEDDHRRPAPAQFRPGVGELHGHRQSVAECFVVFFSPQIYGFGRIHTAIQSIAVRAVVSASLGKGKSNSIRTSTKICLQSLGIDEVRLQLAIVFFVWFRGKHSNLR